MDNTQTQEAPFGRAIGSCDKCDGQGEFLDLRHGIVRCDKCDGAGKIEYALGIGDAYVQQQQRIEALEAALAFYADENNYEIINYPHVVSDMSEVERDWGQIARRALEGGGE